MALKDDEILEAQSLLARCAGIFAEPAGAASLAAARKLKERGIIKPDELVVCTITGHGLKQPSAVPLPGELSRPLAPRLAAIRERLGIK